MLLSSSRRLLLLAVGLSACDAGSPDWVLGTFSNQPNAVGLTSIVHYEFREDGTFARTQVRGCGDNPQELYEEHQWRRVEDSLVVVGIVREGGAVEEWRVRPGETCNLVEVEQVSNGLVRGTLTLERGAVCLYELPPCEINCESCATEWCDEPPPPCDD